MTKWERLLNNGQHIFTTFFDKKGMLEKIQECSDLECLATKITTRIIEIIHSEFKKDDDLERLFTVIISSLKSSINEYLRDKDYSVKIDKVLFELNEDHQIVSNIPISQQPLTQILFTRIIQTISIPNESLSVETIAKMRIYYETLIDTALDSTKFDQFEKNLKVKETSNKIIDYLTDVTKYTEFRFSEKDKTMKEYFVEPKMKLMPKKHVDIKIR